MAEGRSSRLWMLAYREQAQPAGCSRTMRYGITLEHFLSSETSKPSCSSPASYTLTSVARSQWVATHPSGDPTRVRLRQAYYCFASGQKAIEMRQH
jgi:hypothetical protein